MFNKNNLCLHFCILNDKYCEQVISELDDFEVGKDLVEVSSLLNTDLMYFSYLRCRRNYHWKRCHKNSSERPWCFTHLVYNCHGEFN